MVRALASQQKGYEFVACPGVGRVSASLGQAPACYHVGGDFREIKIWINALLRITITKKNTINE